MTFKLKFIHILIFILIISSCEKNGEKRKIKLSNGTTTNTIEQQFTSTVRFAAHDRRSIAVLYFQNRTGDVNLQWLQKGLTEMFIRALSQSANVSVLSMDRLIEILQRLNRENTPEAIDLEIAAMVAKEANVEAVLLGHITKEGDNLQLNIKLQESQQGKIFKEESVEGSSLENIFDMVDNLTQTVKSDLQLALGKAEQDISIAELTTNSVSAWQKYSTGIDLVHNFEHDQAIPFFNEAIDLDSTFISAYHDLCRAYFRTGKNDEGYNTYQKLLQMKNLATPQESYQIDLLEAEITNNAEKYISTIEEWVKKYPEDREAHYTLATLYRGWNNQEKAIIHLHKTIEIDPKYATAYNLLGYSYANLGLYEKATAAITEYQKISPNIANPFDSMGEIHYMFGEFKNAEKQFKKALNINEDFNHSIQMLGLVYMNTGKFKKAFRYFEKLLEKSDNRYQKAEAYNMLAITHLKTENNDKVLENFHKSLDENIYNFNPIAIIHHIHSTMGDTLTAQEELEKIYDRIKKDLFSEVNRERAMGLLAGLSIGWNIKSLETIEIIKEIIKILQSAPSGNTDKIKITNLKFIMTLLLQQTNQLQKIDELWPEEEIMPSSMGNIMQNIRDFSYSDQGRSFGRLNSIYYNYLERGVDFYNYFIKFSTDNSIQQFEMMCRLLLADLYLKSGKEDLANQQLKIVGTPIEAVWKTISPFENKHGFHKKFPVEKGIRLNKSFKNKFGEIAWKSSNDGINDGFINFNGPDDMFNWAVGYGLIYVETPEKRDVQLRFGTDDEVKIWLNDEEVWSLFQGGPAVFDDNKINVKLNKGLNKVLIKVCNSVSDWGFFFRITDKNGIGVQDIKFISADEVL
jgi:tetratricopeptide (TPR) repeat protein